MSGTEQQDYYYLSTDWLHVWQEVTKEEYVRAERTAEFYPTYGRSWDEPATAGFSGAGVIGSISYGKPKESLVRERW